MEERIRKLQELFPECVTEVLNSRGQMEHAIDFNKLRFCLGAQPEEDQERYEFTWVGKKAAYMESMRPADTALQPLQEKSLHWDDTANLYIEGDNLEALKLLQEKYAGSIKVIYIDPPYNTGSDFIYSDRFSKASRDIGRNSGRFHSDWCSMIYTRLLLARNLLTEDGAIFISIDDNEVENLKKICNEVFGEQHFVGQWNWYKSATPPNLSRKIKKNVEYILCYEKQRSPVKYKGLKKKSPSSNGLLNQTNRVSVLAFPANVVVTGLSDGIYPAGRYGTDRYEIHLLDDVSVRDGVFTNAFRLQAKFKWGQEKLLREIGNGTRIAIRTATFSPSYEKTDYDPEVPPNLINRSVHVNTTEEAGKQLTALFDGLKVFDYPKPVDLISYLINFLCGEEDIVMDFFSGSATTAHAVMLTNALQHMHRTFIMVQLPEAIDESSAVYQAGYQTICDIGEERIRRAGKKIRERYPEAEVDTGFRVYRVATP